MYTEKQASEKILKQFPDFKKRYESYLKDWEEEPRSEGGDISEFSSYIGEKLEKNESYDYQKLFDLIEDLVVNGDEVVATAATTMFLENLVNYSANGRFPLESFAKYLGKESKAYCKAWDEFCGVDNGDIWD